MIRALILATAFCASVAVVPALFVIADQLWALPTPQGFRFGSPLEVYFVMTVLAIFVALPGFAIARLGIWLLKATSPGAFAIGGAVAGVVAAIRLCFPDHFWALRAYNLDFISAAIGAVAGVVNWWVEYSLSAKGDVAGEPAYEGKLPR